jgi:antitoxin component of MazEF toxin-antitoxin module
MRPNLQKSQEKIEIQTIFRKRNQITLPSQAVELLGVREGDVIVIEIASGSATLRPVRRSYAGIARGVYGNASDFVAGERTDWE